MLVYWTFAFLLQLSKRNSALAFIGLAPPPHYQPQGTSSVLQSSAQSSSVQQQQQQYAGIPPILNQLECGESVLAYRDSGQHNVTVERCSTVPPIFVWRNFLSSQECDAILQSTSTMEPAQTSFGIKDESTRKKSFVAWLGNNAANATVGRLANAGRQLMLVPGSSLGVEDLQVVRYESSGEYTVHHDGNDRILTVLYYLNGEGETFFPLAKRRQDDCDNRPSTRKQALAAAEGLQPGIDGVLVSTCSSTQTDGCVPVCRGDAVAFYSFFQDGTPDFSAIHSGLPASTEKIIANHFFRHVPNRT